MAMEYVEIISDKSLTTANSCSMIFSMILYDFQQQMAELSHGVPVPKRFPTLVDPSPRHFLQQMHGQLPAAARFAGVDGGAEAHGGGL